MIYRRRRSRQSMPGGYFRFDSGRGRTMSGFGDGDFVRLRDQYGNEWSGQVERQADDTIRYRFRDAEGKSITGVSDSYGVILRDERGNTWRGFID